MSFFLRLFGLVVLLPSLAHAATLGIPGNGTKLSGIGVISGWKCEAEGDLTIIFNDDGKHIPLLYGTERTDVLNAGACDSADVGFVAIWNWGNLDDGEHTAEAYDNGVKFAESTFTVTTPGVGFLTGASKRITVDDFPNPDDTTELEWNQATQHFEIVDFMGSGPIDLGTCVEGLTVGLEEMCSGSLMVFGHEVDFTFTVNAAGQGCVEVDVPPGFPVDIPEIPCLDTAEAFENLLSGFGVSGVDVTKNTDGSWTINSFPTDL